jgi:acyl-CoA thioesterase-1
MTKLKSLGEFFAQLLLLTAMAGLLTSCSTRRSRQYIRETDYSGHIRVACVGDSITYGHGIKDREHDSYPAQLAVLLGEKWQVRNFGVNGATVFKKGSRPYSLQPVYRDALVFEPDVVIIKLGTNDTSPANWPHHKEMFFSDYVDLIHSFRRLKSKPRVYLCRPVPLFRDRGKTYDTDIILTEEIIPRINEAACDESLPVIDLYAALAGSTDLLPDGVHPDAVGAGIMAKTIYTKLTGRTAPNHHAKVTEAK